MNCARAACIVFSLLAVFPNLMFNSLVNNQPLFLREINVLDEKFAFIRNAAGAVCLQKWG